MWALKTEQHRLKEREREAAIARSVLVDYHLYVVFIVPQTFRQMVHKFGEPVDAYLHAAFILN